MVIGLVGPKLSGKGTVAAYFIERYHARTYSMSGILVDIADRLYMPKTRMNLIGIVTGLRDQFGKDVLAHVLKKDIEKNDDPLAVIDGIRMREEVTIFSALSDFRLLYIDAPLELRYNRARGRGEKVGESQMTLEQFTAEESAVTELEISSMKEQTDIIIVNDRTLQELYAQLDTLMSGS